MSEIEERLKTTSEECLKCFLAWDKDRKSAPEREALQDAIHELRKVSSRLEIELAIAERDQMGQKPIAIPAHRNSQNRGSSQGADAGAADNIDEMPQQKPKVQRRRTPRRSASGAGNAAPKAAEE